MARAILNASTVLCALALVACGDGTGEAGASGGAGAGDAASGASSSSRASASSHASASSGGPGGASGSGGAASGGGGATGSSGGGGGGGGQGGAGAPSAGTIVPLYVDPPDAAWDRVAAAATAHPTVRVIAIVNPANGPGPSADADYTTGIAALTAAGVTVIGYVATTYGNKPRTVVRQEIDTWKGFYPQLGGIFFDEMSSSSGDEAFYGEATAYARNAGLLVTVGNPGTDTLPSFVGTVDTMLVYETDGLPDPASLTSWHAGYAPSNFGVIPYKVDALDAGFVASVRPTIGFVYMTDDDLPNPWDTLPPYFDGLLGALE